MRTLVASGRMALVWLGMHTVERLRPFGTTIFAEMTALAIRHGAVNLAQGFPDYDGPREAINAAVTAATSAMNQYARSSGSMELVAAITRWWHERRVVDASSPARVRDPESQVTVTSGCTEAIAATLLGIVEPGDEVVCFEPYYDSYVACCALCGATPRFVPLRAGERGRFEFDEGELRAAIGRRTRAILVNTPHNPTGKVFSPEELGAIARLCIESNILAITDEVYEELTYDSARPHMSLATFDGMADRTVTLSSLGKSFALTGWKVGWAIATPDLSRAVRAAHQFLTFATATPLQHGAAAALMTARGYLQPQREMLIRNRDVLAATLDRIGLVAHPSDGTYFIMADHTALSKWLGLADDVAFCRYLTEHIKVAAIPPTAFYANRELGRRYVRFAYCKQEATIAEAIKRLEVLAR